MPDFPERTLAVHLLVYHVVLRQLSFKAVLQRRNAFEVNLRHERAPHDVALRRARLLAPAIFILNAYLP